MSDLTDFISARLDEDEAAAKAASWDRPGDAWRVWGVRTDDAWVIDDDGQEGFVIPRIGGGADTEGVARHVARHDPARALREVAAKRAIVAEHERDQSTMSPDMGDDVLQARIVTLGRTGSVLRHLASAWSDHPDYRAEWAPIR